MSEIWRSKPIITAAATLAFGLLGACGGGGGTGSSNNPPVASPPPPPPPSPPSGPSAPTYTPGVFEAASTYKDQCQTVRTGVDSEGNPFPDQAATLGHELFWLRSWTDETYLWRDEVVDRDPNAFSNRLSYFDVLKTNEVTPSGEDKDDFHFSQPTADYLEQRNSDPSPSYGASYAILSSSIPRDVRIRYTEPDSPASAVVMGQTNLVRGSRIIEIDGIDVVNGATTQAEIDQINGALYPSTVGETHQFTVRDPGSSADRTISLSAANIAPKPVNRFTTIDTASGKVGYILFNTFSPFSSEKDIADAVRALDTQGVSDLVIDLRYNGGGLLAVSSQLAYMVAGPARTNGKTYELLRFNARAGNRNPVTGAVNSPIPFISTGQGFSLVNGAPLASLDLPRVYILSTARTCSASEALINGLRGIDVEVILIGDTTCGKPFGFYPTGNCGQTYYTIQFQGVNNKNFGDYADGFTPQNSGQTFPVSTPGCLVADTFSAELGDPSETMLAAALQHRIDGTCPSATSPKLSKPGETDATTARDAFAIALPDESLSETNRDLSTPRKPWGPAR